jgi:hypothetical protein
MTNSEQPDIDLRRKGGTVEEHLIKTADDRYYVAEEHSRRDIASAPERHQRHIRRTQRIIFFVTNVIAIFTFIRLLLELANADPNNGFFIFISLITTPFLAPFRGLFGSSQVGYEISVGALVFAILIYYLFAWIISRIVKFAMQRSAQRPRY